MTIDDARVIYENSGLFNLDHGTLEFDHGEFADFFYNVGSGSSDLTSCFVDYIALKNDIKVYEVIKNYSLSK